MILLVTASEEGKAQFEKLMWSPYAPCNLEMGLQD